jgi:hypothetical protein
MTEPSSSFEFEPNEDQTLSFERNEYGIITLTVLDHYGLGVVHQVDIDVA